MQPIVSYNRWSYELLAWGGAFLLHALLLGIHFRSPDMTLRLLDAPEQPVSMVVSLTASALTAPSLATDTPAETAPAQPAESMPVASPSPAVSTPPPPPALPPVVPIVAKRIIPPPPVSNPSPPPSAPSPVTSGKPLGHATSASGVSGSSADTGDATPAQVTQKGTPVYPKAALNDGASGYIEVEVSLSPFGSVTEVKVLQSTGHRALDLAFVTAIRTHYQFAPKRVLGMPVASSMRLEHHFELD